MSALGTRKWVDNLQWTNSSKWALTMYERFSVEGWVEGYERKVENLHYYSVMRAGHMVSSYFSVTLSLINIIYNFLKKYSCSICFVFLITCVK